MATNDHRVGPANINETYEWATDFIDSLCKTFGNAKVQKKLTQWRWDCSTAFSGVGCAESVKTSIPCKLFITQKLQPMLANPRPCTACKLLPGRRRKVLEWRTFDSIGHVNGIQRAKGFWVQRTIAVASAISWASMGIRRNFGAIPTRSIALVSYQAPRRDSLLRKMHLISVYDSIEVFVSLLFIICL